MKKSKITIILFLIVFLAAGTACYAEGNPLTKLSRGITNVVTSPGEFVMQIPPSVERTNNYLMAGLLTIFRGTGFTVVRAATGVFEVVTFPIPFKAFKKYGPVYEPATIFETLYEREDSE